jgi:hypothetical protein
MPLLTRNSMPFLQTVTDLSLDADVLRRRRYGVIEVVDGRLCRVLLRPWPKVLVGPEVLWLGRWMHRQRGGDRLLLYYNHPCRFPNFLALAYALSARETSLRSVRVGLEVLDEIARLKQSDALLCDASNLRISERSMRRFGWVPHCPSSWWHRHFIKRFYGKYPVEAGSREQGARSETVLVEARLDPACQLTNH